MPEVIDGVFTIDKEIGRGGMAVVYLAQVDLDKFDYTTLYAYTQVQAANHAERRRKAEELAKRLKERRLDLATIRAVLEEQGIPLPPERVALKLASADHDSARFEGEWKNLLCLNHDNVIKVYGGGQHEGRCYYVMEYLENIVPLPRIMSEFSIRQRLDIAIQAGRGLQYLHENGLVHRDVKPANLLTLEIEKGVYVTKVTDLGLAKGLWDRGDLTQAQAVMGSPCYMAPEQASSAHDVDHRADIYGVGAALYELMTGVRPYQEKGNALAVLGALAAGERPTPPARVGNGVPPPLAAIIETAMQPNPQDRYDTMDDLVNDLEAYLNEENSALIESKNFPKDAPSAAAVGEGRYAFEGKARRLAPVAAPPGAACRLLVAHRKHTVHQMLTRASQAFGLKYLAALSFREAEEHIAAGQVDLAIIEYARGDIQVATVCEMARVRNIPFFLHGTGLTRDDIVGAVRLGAAGVLAHPLPEQTLQAKLKQLIDCRRGDAAAEPAIDFGGKKTPPERARIVLKEASRLMALPHAATKVIALCNDPNASAEQLAQPVRADSAIAAMVLRRANSAAFGAIQRIQALRDAIVRIGRREIRQMAIALSVFKIVGRKEKSFGFNRYRFWFHALGTAVASRFLAKISGGNNEEAFLAGLLHDLGKAIFDDHLNREYQEVIRRAATSQRRISEVEQEIFLMDHALLGAKVGENWKLPPAVLEAIANHHRGPWPQLTADKPLSLTEIIAMANSACKALGIGHSGDFYVEDIPACRWRKVLTAGKSFTDMVNAMRWEMREFATLLGLNDRDAELNFMANKTGRSVSVIPDGLGLLLQAFFEGRGYSTRLLPWQQALAAEGDVAADLRAIPEEAWLSFFEEPPDDRHIFLLHDKPPTVTLPPRVHLIAPAMDFFALTEAVNAIQAEIATAEEKKEVG
ncbi:MAG: HDOD domain-containing protein [Planctomycetota bacterium]|nr:HDOD domain-containing protein [Planctomycetota bacterium]